MHLNRREFFKTAILTGSALSAVSPRVLNAQAEKADAVGATSGAATRLTDTHVHLFEWPSRKLRYSRTGALVEKLRAHGVTQGWAGSFEGLLAKDIGGVNTRLAEECRREGAGFLLPIGSVNPRWPDWEEDLRRCHEVHKMPGIRVHPGYQGFALEAPEFAQLLRQAARRGVFVQIVLEMEDPRVQHPLLKAPTINPAPLVDLLKNLPAARVQLLNSWQWARQPAARPLLEMAQVAHDISGLEGVGAVGRMIEGRHWYLGGKAPVERVLFGSHAPFYPIEAMLLRLFESSSLTPVQLKAIMETNARRWLTGAP